MKKRFLSLLMAFCLMLSLVPAAFAAEDQTTWYKPQEGTPTNIVRPDGTEIEIPDYNLSMRSKVRSSLSENSTGTPISSADEFKNANWTSGQSFYLTNDIDVSSLFVGKGEWTGAVDFLLANFDGCGHKISGVPNNCYLFAYCIGGSIKNLTFDVGTNAAFLVFGPGTSGGKYAAFTMSNVHAIGNVTLSSTDQANYSPFIYASNPHFTMENCKNFADISGVTYAAVFYGYSTVRGGSYAFSGCENHGNVNLRNAALFFGNPTYLSDTYTSEHNVSVSISNCKNYGQIRSVATEPHYFVTDVGDGMSTFSANIEAQLKSNNAMLTLGGACTEVLCTHKNESATHNGELFRGNAPDGLAIRVSEDGETLKITRATNESEIAYYGIEVANYVTALRIYNDTENNNQLAVENMGTEQISMIEYIDVPVDDTSSTLTAKLKLYAFADEELGESGGEIQVDDEAVYPLISYNGKTYYKLLHSHSSIYDFADLYASGSSYRTTETGAVFVGSTGIKGTAVVSAYNSYDEVVGRAYLGG